MNKKIIYSMLIVLVFLLIISFALKNVGSPTSEPESFSALEIKFDPDSVTKIDVFKQDYPDSGLHFVKLDTSWVVSNAFDAPAKQSDIDKLLTDLDDVSGQVRSKSADLYNEYDISDEKALQIELYNAAGSKVVHVYVGKGGTGQECFVRLAGSPVVYLADNNFISRFAAWNAPPEKRLPTDRWVDLALCDIPRDQIKSFKIKKGKTEYDFALIEEPLEDSLAQPQEVWTQVSPKKGLKLEESKIKRLHSGIAALRASGVVNPDLANDPKLKNPAYSLWIADGDGNMTQIYFGKTYDDAEDRYAVVEGKNVVYTVPKNTFNRIFEDQFKKPDK